jgi:hypothetical protein
MKFTFFILLTFLTSFVSKSQNADSLLNAFTPEKKQAVITPNKLIQLNTKDTINPDFEIVDGNKWLFQYIFKSKEYKQIADDEYTEKITFNILPKKNSFNITSKDFDKINLIYSQSCFCMDAGNYLISSGNISGKKIKNKTWLIKIKIIYTGRRSGTIVNKEFTIQYQQ